MMRGDLQFEIERCLDKVALANGSKRSTSARYAPIRSTKYTKGRVKYHYADGPAKARMSADMFSAIRDGLAQSLDRNGNHTLSCDDLSRLDEAWARYRLEILTAPEEISKHWHQLKRKHQITEDRVATPAAFYWILFELVYKPMLVEDRSTFDANNQALLGAMAGKDAVFPKDASKMHKIWAAYAEILAFCMYRLNDARRQQYRSFLLYLIRKEKLPFLMMGAFSQGYYDNDMSIAASRALAVTTQVPLGDEWKPWRTFELARAAQSALLRGWDLHSACAELQGRTPYEAWSKAIQTMEDDGHIVQSLIFRTFSLLPAARQGDVNAVYAESGELLSRAQATVGHIPHLGRWGTVMRARAHYVASGGKAGFDLTCAYELLNGLDDLFKSRQAGSVAQLIRDVDRSFRAGQTKMVA